MVNKIVNPIVLPERNWVRPKGSKPYYLDIEKKSNELALNRLKAAKVAATEITEIKSPLLYTHVNKQRNKNKSILDLSSDFSINTHNDDIQPIKNDTNSTKIKNLADRCAYLYKRLQIEEISVTNNYMRSLRENLNEILKLIAKIPENERAEGLGKECIQFLTHLSYQINTQAESMKSIEELGKSALKVLSGDVWQNLQFPSNFDSNSITFGQMSKWIEDIFTRLDNDRKDTAWGAIKWKFINFLKWLFGNAPSNENMWIGDIQVGDKNIRLNLGQSFVKEPIGEAQLEYQKNNNQYHIQHTLEDPSKKSENKRIRQHSELFNKYENSKVIASTINGDIRKGKGAFATITSVTDFHTKLLNMLGGPEIPKTKGFFNGFVTGLTSEQIKETIAASKEAFQTIFGEERFDVNDKKAQERYRNAMLLGFTGFLAIKNLLAFGNDPNKPQNATMGQACAEDIDRGPIVNGTMIAFVQMIAKDKFQGQDAAQILGILLMRGMASAGRVMNRDRVGVFADLFDLIDQAKKGDGPNGFVKRLKEFAGEAKITFTPSHKVEGVPQN
jgi:hypothetical protein